MYDTFRAKRSDTCPDKGGYRPRPTRGRLLLVARAFREADGLRTHLRPNLREKLPAAYRTLAQLLAPFAPSSRSPQGCPGDLPQSGVTTLNFGP